MLKWDSSSNMAFPCFSSSGSKLWLLFQLLNNDCIYHRVPSVRVKRGTPPTWGRTECILCLFSPSWIFMEFLPCVRYCVEDPGRNQAGRITGCALWWASLGETQVHNTDGRKCWECQRVNLAISPHPWRAPSPTALWGWRDVHNCQEASCLQDVWEFALISCL